MGEIKFPYLYCNSLEEMNEAFDYVMQILPMRANDGYKEYINMWPCFSITSYANGELYTCRGHLSFSDEAYRDIRLWKLQMRKLAKVFNEKFCKKM